MRELGVGAAVLFCIFVIASGISAGFGLPMVDAIYVAVVAALISYGIGWVLTREGL